MLDMYGLLCAIFSASSMLSALTIVKPVMDSSPRGRSLVPAFEISRPPLTWPPMSMMRFFIDSNQLRQAAMISGVGLTNPYCKRTILFTIASLLVELNPELLQYRTDLAADVPAMSRRYYLRRALGLIPSAYSNDRLIHGARFRTSVSNSSGSRTYSRIGRPFIGSKIRSPYLALNRVRSSSDKRMMKSF